MGIPTVIVVAFLLVPRYSEYKSFVPRRCSSRRSRHSLHSQGSDVPAAAVAASE